MAIRNITYDQIPTEASTTNTKHMAKMKQRIAEHICVLIRENEDMRTRLEGGHPSSPLEDEYQGPIMKNVTTSPWPRMPPI